MASRSSWRRCFDHESTVLAETRRDRLWIDAIGQVELSVELTARCSTGCLLLVASMYDQLLVDGLHSEITRLEVRSYIYSDPES